MKNKLFATILAAVAVALSSGAIAAEKADKERLFSGKEAETILIAAAIRAEVAKPSLARMEAESGKKGPFNLAEIDAYAEAWVAAAKADKAAAADEANERFGYKGPKTFPWIRLRRSFTDVLASEDPTLDTPGEKTFDDIQGALLSFSRDFLNDTDTWSAQAAFMAPFSWSISPHLSEDTIIHLARVGVIPSFSINRISTSGDPEGEVDEKSYRVGIFGKLESGVTAFKALTFRGFGVYTKDDQHDAEIWAGEFEAEPQADFSKYVKLGYRAILLPKRDKAKQRDVHDTAILAYQFRALLHGEYASVNNNGANFMEKEYEYFRLGPSLQLDLKPFFTNHLAVSLRYLYQPTISGEDTSKTLGIDANDSLFTADAEWFLIDPIDNPGSRLSIKASYIKGGFGVTQENTETLLIGLGAAF